MSRGTYFFNIECFETVTHVGVHLATILLPQLLECWDSRNPPPRLAKGAFFIFKGGFTILRDHHASPALSPGVLWGGAWWEPRAPVQRELSYWPSPAHRLLLLAAWSVTLIGQCSK